MKKFSLILLLLFLSQFAYSYSDNMHWWYGNACGQPGSYMVAGNGIDASNGGYFNGGYWKGTNFRPGDVIFNRNLITGVNTTYLGGTSLKTNTSTYTSGTENNLQLYVGTSYSAGNMTLNYTYIRYYNEGIWTDWEDLAFSVAIPARSAASFSTSKIVNLRDDIAYQTYQVKFNSTIPSNTANKQIYLSITTIDDTGNNFDPLNANIPESETMLLLGLGLMVLFIIRKF